jgi:RNA polymerase sigma-70 factor (ECF subfamily)
MRRGPRSSVGRRRHAGAVPGLALVERTVNGQPGLVAQLDGATMAVLAFDVADDRIQRIWTVLTPEKLRPSPPN